jgi:hypothetical protein
MTMFGKPPGTAGASLDGVSCAAIKHSISGPLHKVLAEIDDEGAR